MGSVTSETQSGGRPSLPRDQTGPEAVKCRRCGRLLGILESGEFVNKHGKQIIRAERADISCPRCGAVTHTGGPGRELEGESGKLGKTRQKRADFSRAFSSREGEGLGVRVAGGCPAVRREPDKPSGGKG